nr:hypothetical protein CFP56_51420 [Quercus suber]
MQSNYVEEVKAEGLTPKLPKWRNLDVLILKVFTLRHTCKNIAAQHQSETVEKTRLHCNASAKRPIGSHYKQSATMRKVDMVEILSLKVHWRQLLL